MPGLEDLYKEIILDHYRNPRNRGELPPPACKAEGFNPLCGDEIVVTLTLDENEVIQDIAIGGQGCSISQSSASMMSAAVKGKSVTEVRELTDQFKTMMSINEAPSSSDDENDLFLWMFHRRHPQLAVLGPANLAAGGYWGLSAAADLIVNHVRDQAEDPDRWKRFRAVIEGPEPDLSGGYDYYQKPGHLNYVNAAALDEYSGELFDEFGFEPLTLPPDFVPPELIDIDEWLAEPGPVDMPSHGSLTPIPYQPEDLING